MDGRIEQILPDIRDVLLRLVDVVETLMGVPAHRTVRAIRRAWRTGFKVTCPKCGHTFTRVDANKK